MARKWLSRHLGEDGELDGFAFAEGRYLGYLTGWSDESVNSASFVARAALISAESSVASGS